MLVLVDQARAKAKMFNKKLGKYAQAQKDLHKFRAEQARLSPLHPDKLADDVLGLTATALHTYRWSLNKFTTSPSNLVVAATKEKRKPRMGKQETFDGRAAEFTSHNEPC